MSRKSSSADSSPRWILRSAGYALLALAPLAVTAAVLGYGFLATRRAAPGSSRPASAAAVEPPPGPSLADPVPAALPPGWKRAGEVERFPGDRMFEKIDGGAEAFLSRGARELVYMGFETDAGDLADVYLYDMGSPGAAEEMFAEDSGMEPKAADGYRGRIGVAESTVYLLSGRYYVQIFVSAARGGTETARALARGIDERLAATSPTGKAGS